MPCRRRMRAGISKPLILRPSFPSSSSSSSSASVSISRAGLWSFLSPFCCLFIVQAWCHTHTTYYSLTNNCPPFRHLQHQIQKKPPNTYQILLFYKSPVDFTRNLITSSCLLSTISPKYHDSATNDNRDFRPIHETINHLTITNQST